MQICVLTCENEYPHIFDEQFDWEIIITHIFDKQDQSAEVSKHTITISQKLRSTSQKVEEKSVETQTVLNLHIPCLQNQCDRQIYHLLIK